LARAAVIKALEIDDTVADAHLTLGSIAYRYEWDFTKAEREYKRARQLDPANLSDWFGFYLMTVNRLDEAEAEFKRLEESRPLTTGYMSLYYFFLRQYDRAEQEVQKSLDTNSNNGPTHVRLGLIYEQKGMYKEAISEFQKAVKLSNNGFQSLGMLAHCYAVSGRRDEAKKILADIAKLSNQDFFWANYVIAAIYAGLGENEEAIRYLERAYDEHSLSPAWFRFDPRLDKLRLEPHFQEFVRRTGLPVQ
jgi:tetratricopeptide (TPR) repeat protein